MTRRELLAVVLGASVLALPRRVLGSSPEEAKKREKPKPPPPPPPPGPGKPKKGDGVAPLERDAGKRRWPVR